MDRRTALKALIALPLAARVLEAIPLPVPQAVGDVYYDFDARDLYRWNGSSWDAMGVGPKGDEW